MLGLHSFLAALSGVFTTGSIVNVTSIQLLLYQVFVLVTIFRQKYLTQIRLQMVRGMTSAIR